MKNLLSLVTLFVLLTVSSFGNSKTFLDLEIEFKANYQEFINLSKRVLGFCYTLEEKKIEVDAAYIAQNFQLPLENKVANLLESMQKITSSDIDIFKSLSKNRAELLTSRVKVTKQLSDLERNLKETSAKIKNTKSAEAKKVMESSLRNILDAKKSLEKRLDYLDANLKSVKSYEKTIQGSFKRIRATVKKIEAWSENLPANTAHFLILKQITAGRKTLNNLFIQFEKMTKRIDKLAPEIENIFLEKGSL